MSDRLSTATAIKGFFDGLPHANENINKRTYDVICEAYGLAPNSLEASEFLHAQRGNIYRLVAELVRALRYWR